MENSVRFLAEEQAKLGNDVTVVCSNNLLMGLPHEEVFNEVKIIRLPSLKLFYSDLRTPLRMPLLSPVDIIHAHGQNSLFSLNVARKLKQKSAAKLVFCFLAVDAFSDHPNYLVRSLGPTYGHRMVKEALRLSDCRLVKVSRDAELLRKEFETDSEYLPDGIPNLFFDIGKQNSEEFRKRFAIKQENIILFIGRLHPLKGPHILVQALKHLNDEHVAVAFIGPDDGFSNVINDLSKTLGVSNQVYNLGFVDEETKIAALDACVAMVLPSVCDYTEVNSIVISEAWARAKPVIASRIGGLPYRVHDHVNGLLVNPSDPLALSKAISEVLINQREAEKMGLAGSTDVLPWKDIALKSLKIYSEIKMS